VKNALTHRDDIPGFVLVLASAVGRSKAAILPAPPSLSLSLSVILIMTPDFATRPGTAVTRIFPKNQIPRAKAKGP